MEVRELAFTLAFVDEPALPEAGFFFCQHGRPEHFWSAAAQVHANGAKSLNSVTLCHDTPSAYAAVIATICGAEAAGPAGTTSIPTGDGTIALVTPGELDGAVAGRFAAFCVAVPSLGRLRHLLDQGCVPYRSGAGSIVVPAAHAFGVDDRVPGGVRQVEHKTREEDVMNVKAEVVVGSGERAVRFGNALPLALIAGPCALESRDHALFMADALAEIAGRLGIGLVYKSSFDKANRTSSDSARGLGLDKALTIFDDVKRQTGLPVLTDVHDALQCGPVAEVVDVLQIPAFLCRPNRPPRRGGRDRQGSQR